MLSHVELYDKATVIVGTITDFMNPHAPDIGDTINCFWTVGDDFVERFQQIKLFQPKISKKFFDLGLT